MTPEQGVSREFCTVRSGSIQRVQEMAERRLDHHSRKLDELAAASIQLTAAVERVSLILEKQDQRLERAENRDLYAFLSSSGGKSLLRIVGIGTLLLLSAGVGVNIFQIVSEVI